MSAQAMLKLLAQGPVEKADALSTLGLSASAWADALENLRAAGIEIIACDDQRFTLAQPIEWLDRDAILAALPLQAREQLQSLVLTFETDSTQQQALSTSTPEQGCALWLAERQTAGQGRRGRRWISPLAANLMLSLSRRFDGGYDALTGLSLAVGVAAAEALHSLGHESVRVKWPNDLVVDDRKLGGILVNLRGNSRGPAEAVIGLGLNVHMPAISAADIDQPWCDLAMLDGGIAPSRNRVAAALLAHLLPALSLFDREGLTPFLSRWQQLDALLGRRVQVRDGAQNVEGIALGVDARGALRLRTDAGEKIYHGGETSLRPA